MKFRNELKYYINMADYFAVKNRLKHIATNDKFADENGEYVIRSIYFDNYKDKALQEKLLGVNNRSKFRMRIYNNNADAIKLEKKSKVKNLTNKATAVITADECCRIIEGDWQFLLQSEKPLLRELYTAMKNDLLCPKTIVEYTREAYVYKPGNVRVTFDKNLKTGIVGTDFLNSEVPVMKSMESNMIIMEVKYDAFLPEIIFDLIQTNERRNSAISKYALCRIYG